MAISAYKAGDSLFKLTNAGNANAALATAKAALAAQRTAPAAPSPTPASSSPPGDVIRLSDEAKQAHHARQQEMRAEIIAKYGRLRLSEEAERGREQHERWMAVQQEFGTYSNQMAERGQQVADSLFDALGVEVPKGPDPGNLPATGLSYTGAIGDVLTRNPSLTQVTKSAALQAWEDDRHANSDPEPPLPEIMNKVSEVQVFLPGTEGNGSKQVSLHFDNAALEKLASMSEEQLRASLKSFAPGDAVAAQVGGSAIGEYLASGHGTPDPKVKGVTMAGIAVMDPDNPSGAPLMTLHSNSVPDHVREKGADMIIGMVKLLKQSYPAQMAVPA